MKKLRTGSPSQGSQDRSEGTPVSLAYSTELGSMVAGRIEDALVDPIVERVRGKVDLLFTSPPFPLLRKKRYGNESGEGYVAWLKALAPQFASLLSPTGSIVIEIGNAWVEGMPVMSTLPLEALLAFKSAGKLQLCQQIICHNPARLPSPVVWVNIKRIRLKDSYTHIWWMSRSDRPKADNRRVQIPYGPRMKKLLDRQTYNSGRRPSGHVISETSFLVDNGGAIASSVIDMHSEEQIPPSLLRFSGTGWDARYRQYCKDNNLMSHPARMQMDLASFFIEFLTDPGDIVMDPFAGSNTTGAAAEQLGRRWFGVEADNGYVEGSKGRFETAKLLSSP